VWSSLLLELHDLRDAVLLSVVRGFDQCREQLYGGRPSRV